MANTPPVSISGRLVGRGEPVYLVAELSGNHNGDLGRAIETVHAAADAGADAIKLQTYTPETMTVECERPDFIVPGEGPWSGRTLYDLYREAHTPWDWHPQLFEVARERGLEIFSTPFDVTAVAFLEEFGVPAYKVASFELADDQLLRTIAATQKPVILSTGMSNLEEITHALAVLRSAGAAEIVVLRCTSSYPAPDDAMNLATIPTLEKVTGCPVGLSDHSLGTVAPVVAVALGACLVEKHLTVSREDGGVDSHFSLEPDEFRQLVEGVRRAELMIGEPTFGPASTEKESMVFRRSLYVVADVAEGDVLTPSNVRAIRPGYGLAPRFLDIAMGKRAARSAPRGTAVTWSLLCREESDNP